MSVPVTLVGKQMVLHFGNTRGGVMLLLSAALLALTQTAPDYETVQAYETDGRCEMRVGGVLLDEEALTAKTREWIGKNRQIVIASREGTSQRCVFGTWKIVTMAGPAKVAIFGYERGVAP
jgi:hypothetical protein